MGEGAHRVHSSSSPGAGCDRGSHREGNHHPPNKSLSLCLDKAWPVWHLWGAEHPCHETLEKWAEAEIGLILHLT